METYLIRHTCIDVPTGICYGQSDLPLADSFERDWEEVRKKIPRRLDAVYSSPLARCKNLAQFLFQGQPICDPRLLEMNFGDWEMRPWEDIGQKRIDGWAGDYVYQRIPNGESFFDLTERVKEFMDEISETAADAVAVVAHAGVIRSILACVAGQPLKSIFNIPVDYGAVSLVDISKGVKTIRYINA